MYDTSSCCIIYTTWQQQFSSEVTYILHRKRGGGHIYSNRHDYLVEYGTCSCLVSSAYVPWIIWKSDLWRNRAKCLPELAWLSVNFRPCISVCHSVYEWIMRVWFVCRPSTFSTYLPYLVLRTLCKIKITHRICKFLPMVTQEGGQSAYTAIMWDMTV